MFQQMLPSAIILPMEYTIKLDQFEDQGALVVARVISVLDDGVL